MTDPILVVRYDPAWPQRFAELGRRLRNALSDAALRIDHIGSTAVPGLDAKPIIDLQISVASFEPLNAYRFPLERDGYIFRPENPDLTKRYFRERPGERRTHIHVRRAGSWSEQLSLLFRDYMRAHPADAAQYAELKRALADKHREDRAAYTDAKAPFIWNVMMQANRWSQDVGWEPGPSDA
ncbi:MAG: GrpB family protein [Candidatus Bipolaricaulota bacterium]